MKTALAQSWEDEFEKRFRWYARPILDVEKQSRVTPALLEKYPALRELHHQQRTDSAAFVADFAKHLQHFAPVSSPQRIDFVPSDPHHGGRRVLRVHFADGSRWFYKPRSGQSEAGWFRLLEWVNASGFPAPFEIVPLVTGSNHCWMRAVEAAPVRHRSDAADYFFRAGAIIYLADMLRAVDLHAGNLIAHRSQPVLIDAETFWHAHTRLPVAVRSQATGLLRTGLLPLTPTDEISAFGRRAEGPHLVRLNGVAISISDFADQVVAGFSTMHDLWRRQSPSRSFLEQLFFGRGERRSRRIYRPTSLYAETLRRSLQPPLLRSPHSRRQFLERTCADGLAPKNCHAHEVTALLRGDIPVFYGRSAPPRSIPNEFGLKRSLRLLRRAIAPKDSKCSARYRSN